MLFCLVHGSAQNAACWNLLVPELEAHGHSTVRPQLSLRDPDGSRSYTELISGAIPKQAEDVVLVGHSAAGYFLPLVASQRRLCRVVFLAATIPQLGMSFLDQLRADPSMFSADWRGQDPYADDAVAMRFLFHDCSPRIAQWALTIRIGLPREVSSEIYPLEQWPSAPCSSIFCSQDRTISPHWSRRAARERLGVEGIEIPGGHCPYLSRPLQLATILVSLDLDSGDSVADSFGSEWAEIKRESIRASCSKNPLTLKL